MFTGFAVWEDEQWKQVPFVVPVRTGIFMTEGNAASNGHDEVKQKSSSAPHLPTGELVQALLQQSLR
jgi:hypothetical protein